jgi:hypothetical protein
LPLVSFLPYSSLHLQSLSLILPAKSLPTLMGTHTTTIIPLANTHRVDSLKLTNTNYLYWRMQMKPYLLGQGVFHFVDGLVSCPPFYIFYSSAGSSSTISPSFLRWKQQDPTYFECFALFSLRGCVASRGRLFYLALRLAHS